MTFVEQLRRGQTLGEGPIAAWLMSRGNSVLPVYEKEIDTGKGPQLFTSKAGFAAPDLLTFNKARGPIFVEAKYKTVFTWYRSRNVWTTGIDLRHYDEYKRVAEETGLPVWLLFFHDRSTPDNKDLRWNCPLDSPTGLYGNCLSVLMHCESHRALPKDTQRLGHVGHGASGMVYWAEHSLVKLATKEDVLGAIDSGCPLPAYMSASCLPSGGSE
ncbi:MAG: hypothetical protein E6R03_06390 [Hyphomicrobiaceae bacterium]|nr:MAG: hypothetical protein E6R03_06390 [Hyphomicrobiaceae bacterium]